jgi:hypothetical protein
VEEQRICEIDAVLAMLYRSVKQRKTKKKSGASRCFFVDPASQQLRISTAEAIRLAVNSQQNSENSEKSQ